ncbi:MAG: type I restriction-modification system subunit M [SAR86 cluster bacterium]|uniref:site-specific DNA-methyltransferase (adenine-specific) n=1 Tax=SAR86 cluster bacterium TaxID=2030880 RepID=A0A2A5CHF3_9GAMM|nr:MAG: type I restriction-modification system subunit M [SAR86 cluster bacterium]
MSQNTDKKNKHNQVVPGEINKTIWAACDTFRGTVDPSIYKDYVLTMLFLKYISDVWQDHYETYKEEHGDHPELIEELLKNERFVLPKDANFYALYDRRFEPGNGERIDIALHAVEDGNGSKLQDGDHGVFQDISFNSTKLGDEAQKNDILRHLLEDFNKPELNLRPSRIGNRDIIGDAYEFLIEKFAAGAGKKAGEFYTPAEVSQLITELVEPKEGDDICDPACGSASLLMKCGQYIKQHSGSKKYALYGQEAIGSTWALAKMNMFLHGEDNHKIKWGDTLRNPRLLNNDETLQHFDVVVANPPFSLDKWGHESADNDKHGRFRRGIPPKTKADYAFILHMIETMKPKTGRMGVVVPHGVLFRSASEGRIRQKLIEENLLDTVIGLPEKLFYGTGIPAAILIFKKHKKDKKVLFIDASREFNDGKNQSHLGREHLDKILATYKSRKNLDKYAYLASLEEIKENDFNLNIPRYVDTFEEEELIDLASIRQERIVLKASLEKIESQMNQYLEGLGYDT